MNVLVCFKVVTDYDKVSTSDFRKGDFSYVKKTFGFFDEGALELALRFKDLKEDTYLEAITLGEVDEISISKLYSLGFNKVTVLEGKESIFNTREVSNCIAKYINSISYDLILTGEMVGPNDTGAFPFHLGSALNLPVIFDVAYFDEKYIYEEGINSKKKYDMTKAILVISNSKYPYLRFPKYRDIENSKEKKANIVKCSYKENKVKNSVNIKEKKDIKYIEVKDMLELFKEVINDN